MVVEIVKKKSSWPQIIPEAILNWTYEFKGEGTERTKVREYDRVLQNLYVSFNNGFWYKA